MMMFRGGGSQRSKAFLDAGYSETAQRTGKKPSYQEPNSQSMQKTRRRGPPTAEKLPRRTYLKHIRDSMHRPIEGEVPHPKNVGGEVAIGAKIVQTDVGKPAEPAY